MKLLSRVLAVAIASLYGLSALPFLLMALMPLASALSEPTTTSAGVPSVLLLTAIFLVIAVVLLAASLGLLKERRWARWPFLIVAFLASVAAARTVPMAVAIVDHFHRPPEGAYVVLSEADVAAQFERFVFPSVWLFALTVAAAVFVFHRTR